MISGIFAGTLIVLFVGIVLWAYSAGNKEQFDKMANLPLQEDAPMNQEDRHHE